MVAMVPSAVSIFTALSADETKVPSIVSPVMALVHARDDVAVVADAACSSPAGVIAGGCAKVAAATANAALPAASAGRRSFDPWSWFVVFMTVVTTGSVPGTTELARIFAPCIESSRGRGSSGAEYPLHAPPAGNACDADG